MSFFAIKPLFSSYFKYFITALGVFCSAWTLTAQAPFLSYKPIRVPVGLSRDTVLGKNTGIGRGYGLYFIATSDSLYVLESESLQLKYKVAVQRNNLPEGASVTPVTMQKSVIFNTNLGTKIYVVYSNNLGKTPLLYSGMHFTDNFNAEYSNFIAMDIPRKTSSLNTTSRLCVLSLFTQDLKRQEQCDMPEKPFFVDRNQRQVYYWNTDGAQKMWLDQDSTALALSDEVGTQNILNRSKEHVGIHSRSPLGYFNHYGDETGVFRFFPDLDNTPPQYMLDLSHFNPYRLFFLNKEGEKYIFFLVTQENRIYKIDVTQP